MNSYHDLLNIQAALEHMYNHHRGEWLKSVGIQTLDCGYHAHKMNEVSHLKHKIGRMIKLRRKDDKFWRGS